MKLGEMKIDVQSYTSLVRENEKMYQKLKAVSGLVMQEHFFASNHGYRGSVYCENLSTLLGITLPTIQKEGEENNEK